MSDPVDLAEDVNPAETAEAWEAVLAARDWIRALEARLLAVENMIVELAGPGVVEVRGRRWCGGQRRLTGWQSDDLVRAVLDSRLVDAETGEVMEETPVDRLRDVWPLAGYQARTGRLKARGIDVDEFAHVEYLPRMRELR